MNDILTRLQNGESVDAIAAEFTKALNEASAKYEAEKNQKNKIKDIRAVTDAFNHYLATYYPDSDLAATNFTDEDCAELIDTIDNLIQLGISITSVFKVPSPTLGDSDKTPTAKTPSSTFDFDSIFDTFFGKCVK